jgi:hypothetical protein
VSWDRKARAVRLQLSVHARSINRRRPRPMVDAGCAPTATGSAGRRCGLAVPGRSLPYLLDSLRG